VPVATAPSTTTAGAAAGEPPEHPSNMPAASNFGAVVLPVSMALIGPTPLVLLVQVSVGILNSAVTLVAVVDPNTHPPNVVLVLFARPAVWLTVLSWYTVGSAARLLGAGPVAARAGAAMLAARPTAAVQAMMVRVLASMVVLLRW
jgi:hypothetical protein